MVADGMGGAQAGEIASRMTTEEFAQVDLIPPRGEDTLREVIVAANAKINLRAAGRQQRRRDGHHRGCGAGRTMTARSHSPTSETAAPTCCGTVSCSV